MIPKKMFGKLVSKRNLAGNNWMFTFRFEEKMDFLPGQYISLKVNDLGLRRSYSVVSLPGTELIELMVDVSPMGPGSKYLLGLKEGDVIEALGFLGRFVYDENEFEEKKKVVMLATGTGIAPFRPMVKAMLEDSSVLEIKLVWGMRYDKDLYWIEELEDLKKKDEKFDFGIYISKPSENWTGNKGRFTSYLENLPYSEEVVYYLCGSKEMITEVVSKLLDKGVPREKILFEKFY